MSCWEGAANQCAANSCTAAPWTATATPVPERSRLHALRRSGGEFLEVQRMQATQRGRGADCSGSRVARPLPAWLQESESCAPQQLWQCGSRPGCQFMLPARPLADPALSLQERRVELDWVLDEEEEENLRPRSDDDSVEVLEATGDSDQDTAVPPSLPDKDAPAGCFAHSSWSSPTCSATSSWSLPSNRSHTCSSTSSWSLLSLNRSPACSVAHPVDATPPPEITWQTTAMLRNIPCRLLKDDLANVLNAAGMEGDYDFLYVPTNGKWAKSNLGYGFVNFRTPELLQRCYDALHGRPLGATRSTKLCRISLAHVQGRENLLRQFNAKPDGARVSDCGPLAA